MSAHTQTSWTMDAIKAAAKALPVSREMRTTHHRLCDAGGALQVLILASQRLLDAFEAIGNATGPVSNTSLHAEAEAALICLSEAMKKVTT